MFISSFICCLAASTDEQGTAAVAAVAVGAVGVAVVQYHCQQKANALKKKWKDQIKKDNNRSTLRNMKGECVCASVCV